jgi:hypothetical protein
MTEDDIRDLATVKANVLNIAASMNDFRDLLKSNEASNIETGKQLVAIKANQNDTKDYQVKCEAERLILVTEHGKLEKRMTAAEGFLRLFVRITYIGWGFISFLALGGNKIIIKILEAF